MERDYKKEYARYGKSRAAKKYRAALNKYNRQKGTYGNGDGKDAAHSGRRIKGFMRAALNRANNRPKVRNSKRS